MGQVCSGDCHINWQDSAIDDNGETIEVGACTECGATYRRPRPDSKEGKPELFWFCQRCKHALPTGEFSDEQLWEGIEIPCPNCNLDNYIEGWTAATDSVGSNEPGKVETPQY